MTESWSDLAIELLPKVLQEFVRLIGVTPTMMLVEKYGGVRLYVPINPTPSHPLAELIGFENLCKLSREYGLQDHFDIPKAVRTLRHLRDRKIIADYKHKSASTIALEHNVTERLVFYIVGRAHAEEVNSDLFG